MTDREANNTGNPHEGTYDLNIPDDKSRKLRDDGWNEDVANEDFDAAFDKFAQSRRVEGASRREIEQSGAYEARTWWLVGEDKLAVFGIRNALKNLRSARRRDKSHHPLKRDQYEDHNLPWAAVIEATTEYGSKWRAVKHVGLGLLSVAVSQDPRFRREVDPKANRAQEAKSRLKKNLGAGAIVAWSFVDKAGARAFAKKKFRPTPDETAKVHRLEE